MSEHKAKFIGYEWDNKKYMRRVYEYRGHTYTVIEGVYTSLAKQHEDAQGQIDSYHALGDKNNYTPGRTGETDLKAFLAECDF